MVTYGNLIAELEDALAHGTEDRRTGALRHVTDLFVIGLTQYSDDQIALFDDVFVRLAAKIETAARALLAARLAAVPNAPPATMRALAFDDAIEVAGPVLSQSARLDDAALVEKARAKSQQHLLAIARRKCLDEVVTEVLVERGDHVVVLCTAQNPGARFSDAGYQALVERAHGHDDLAACVGLRDDIPRHLFLKLLTKASAAVRMKLEAADPLRSADIQLAVAAVANTIQARTNLQSKDYHAAQALVGELLAAGQLGEQEIAAFAKAGQFEQATAALAALCKLPIEAIERAMIQDRAEMVLILAKAIDLSWQTTKAILRLRAGPSGLSTYDADQCLANFTRLKSVTARQVLQFQRSRANT